MAWRHINRSRFIPTLKSKAEPQIRQPFALDLGCSDLAAMSFY
jgi:hypothetical protein